MSATPEYDIELRGVETHNLKRIDVAVPRGRLTVVSGVSGSGKSSLAFDTLYAEGQRRYVETLSTYARQFLDQMRRPPVQVVRNIPPAIALRQGTSLSNPRSSVATLTELLDHLQLLFARGGVVHCRNCDARVLPYTVQRVIDWLAEHAAGQRIVVIATARPSADGMGDLMRQLVADGYRRAWLDGALVEIDSEDAVKLVRREQVDVVIDRLSVDPGEVRLREALEAAQSMGEGNISVVLWDQAVEGVRPVRTFHRRWVCGECGTPHTEPIPALFHPFHAMGACPRCEGFGRSVGLDPARAVPDPSLTIEGGALAIFDHAGARTARRWLHTWCVKEGVPLDLPWRLLPEATRESVLFGARGWTGASGWLEETLADRTAGNVRFHAMRFRSFTTCAACRGTGLNPDARATRVGGLDLGAVLRLRIDEARGWADSIRLPGELALALDRLLKEIRDRLGYLADAGLGYLTLQRPARTLSGGEMHRVILATSLGRMLTDTLYVLDEPTAGLHAHDTERLMRVVTRLRDIGNTVVVVEHDPDVIRMAEHIIELGPAGGSRGGRLLYAGDLPGLASSDSPTGELLRARALAFSGRRVFDGPFLEVRDAWLNNLSGVSARFPHGALSVVVGVSGSGKSSLVTDVLHVHLQRRRGAVSGDALPPAVVLNDPFSEVVLVDQGAINRSSRSCALTFSAAYTPLRDLFAATEKASDLRLSASDFSFNVAGGRCERCEGAGVLQVEMVFFADVDIPCDVCEGRRFGPEVLSVQHRGRTIADVLEMSVREALEVFADVPAIVRRLEPLDRVGLGYLRLGQPTTQMSGGELQRLKLASYVGQSRADGASGVLFIFDEPTVGLHMRDVELLVAAIRELTDAGHTAIVVEHNLDLVAASDWVVELGPGAGPEGGTLVYEGPVAGLIDEPRSPTGAYLRETFTAVAVPVAEPTPGGGRTPRGRGRRAT
jgi:excinuclease ABC subunit A